VISNRANHKGTARANRAAWRIRRCAASVLLKLIGASVLLALCASAPLGALAQTPTAAPDAAAAVPAAAASGAAVIGSSIRKAPGAAPSGAPAPADNTAAAVISSLPSEPAPANAGTSAPAAKPAGAPASAAGATSLSDTRGAATFAAAPVTTESAGEPAALATPAARARARRRTHSNGPTQSASAKTNSRDSGAATNAKDSTGPDSPFSSLQFSGSKGPINIKSDALNLDYKGNVVTFRGHVHANQGDATLTSDMLTVAYGKDFHEVKQMLAEGNVRMSQGARWATGDHAILDQARHTVILTGSPVVHDGEDQVTGSKITVHLDTGKSEVEGARAVFFPKDQQTRDNKTTVAKSP